MSFFVSPESEFLGPACKKSNDHHHHQSHRIPFPSLLPVVCCIIAFLLGLLFVQRSGNYFVAMFDDYSAGLPLTVVVILENISVAWIYGTKR